MPPVLFLPVHSGAQPTAMVQDKRPSGEMRGRRKAAVLLTLLGAEVAADVYRNMSDEDIEQITLEIANLGSISPEITGKVIEEFYHTCMAKQYISHGGVSTAREILERALGPAKSIEIIEKLQGLLQGAPFDFLRKVRPAQLMNFLQNEHPQTIALVLAHLEFDQSAQILSALPAELRKEVAVRIATMDQTAPEVIAEVERVLEGKIATVLSQETVATSGVESLAEILNRMDGSSEKTIMEGLEQEDRQLAMEVKRHMFTFEDVLLLDDRAIQYILREVDKKDLAMALRGANTNVRNKIFSNFSERAAGDLNEEIEFMGPVRIKKVEEAQQRIVEVVRRLEESGEILVPRPGDEEEMI